MIKRAKISIVVLAGLCASAVLTPSASGGGQAPKMGSKQYEKEIDRLYELVSALEEKVARLERENGKIKEENQKLQKAAKESR